MQRSLLLLLSLQASYCLAFSTQSPFKVVSRAQLDLGHENIDGHRSSSSVALSSSTNNGGGDDSPINNFLQSIFSSPSSAAVAKPEAIPDFVVDSDYKIAVLFAALGLGIIATIHGVGGLLIGGLVTLLASLFAVQAGRIRFVFDKDCFELKTVDSLGSDVLADSGENIIVGGANRWKYTSFVNYDFFPSLDFPILVYFKETQTPKPDGSEPGQIHFFPAGMCVRYVFLYILVLLLCRYELTLICFVCFNPQHL